MKTIFRKGDFHLCKVPVPKGYPQSQTHSGVALYKGKYYLTTSPYPLYNERRYIVYLKAIIRKVSRGILFPPKSSESFENPCLYIQDAGNEELFPTVFKLMQEHPLMETPEFYYGLPAFNSDPDIFIEEGKIYVLNRSVYRTKLCPDEPLNKYENILYLISGEIDNEKFKLEQILRIQSSEERSLASPCLVKYKELYYLMELETNSYNDGKTFEGLYKISSKQVQGLKYLNNWDRIKMINNGDYLPWHMSVFQYKERLYSIVACVKKGEKQRCWQLLGQFNDDLSKMELFQTPLTDFKSYRSSAVVNHEGEFVLYNTTVHERIPGSISVDGRDVIMAHAQFEDILNKLKENG